ncbi:tetratricopeptide repeat protein 39B-like isoform X2 [Nomia melanderi]|nr:tetratricopeptide repeat protein 39B-like isoform X2 [Nomia melanderi]XP_031834688.1 tetratricopeptide repeat protein 39B-like isoform X2 [Nomia melanderi]XP_031834689.1 tetratricopeptide repeat protein 39B-like isoform X2 [Nomia melanderi]XP_031834690.1 tetratricopeptide repeat protein 39B-like isoform X2 [Nomia melanderi]XP_031834691.1 tetratricopeptide repeat protein 39B-like isoform X2 [Nomia melanderi]XP_031834692.1 tetratricopeptide repeat protein 39B-like isoform X2 [Nomia melanderi]
MSDIEEDEFQDAQESIPEPISMDLDTAIMEAKKAIHWFFNNEFEEARKIMLSWANSSIYHSLGTCVFAFLEAVITFEQPYIKKASAAVKQCTSLCSKQRKCVTLTQNIGKMVKKANYDAYTLEEVHAELCYAESLLFKSILTFVEDETLVSFVKAGLKIRSCFLSYKECLTILNNRKWENEVHRIHFESGVRTGIGAFNLMISLLPARIIKLLEFIGFSGDKEYGLSELEAGYREKRGLRHILCAMILLFYNLMISFILSNTDGDLEWCERVLEEELSHHPNSVWFLFFKGRLELTRGNFENAIEWYTKSWKSQDLWPRFHLVCFWELMWVHCALQQWEEAATFAYILVKESKWTCTVSLYQQAAILLMEKPPPKSEKKQCIDFMMMQAPTFKQRIAGKSLPIEKFVIKKTERYFAQKDKLVLPVFELMYVWNLFRIIGKRQDLTLNIFKQIEESERELMSGPKSEFHGDNEALLLLLKGACLRQLKRPLLAEDCLTRVLSLDKSIKEDTYILPFATVELALLAKDQGNIPLAIEFLKDAKNNYTGYLLETRLHFRIHSDLMNLTGKKVEDVAV